MKKLIVLFVLLGLLGLTVGTAEEAENLGLTATIEFSLSDDDVKEGRGAFFTSDSTGATADLSLDYVGEKVEAGITLGLVPAIILAVEEDDADPGIDPTADSGTGYEFIKAMCNWYLYKMEDQDYTNDTGGTGTFPVTDFTAIAYNTADLITFNGSYDVADPTEEDAEPLKVQVDYINIKALVEGQIELMSTVYASSAIPTGADTGADECDFIYQGWDALETAAALAEEEMFDDYYEYVYGEDVDDAWAAAHVIKSAYLRIKEIAGVVDLGFELFGKAIGVGSMVTSYKSTDVDANVGFSLGLSEGVVEGLSVGVLLTTSEEDAEVDEDYETLEVELAEADQPIWGVLLSGGYATDMFGANIGVGAIDVKEMADFILNISPFLSMADLYDLSVTGEFNIVGGDDMGMGLGASVGANIMGIAPGVSIYWKNEYFGGDDTIDGASDLDDITDDVSMMAEFDSTDLDSAIALAIALSADLEELTGMKLVTLSGGLDKLLSGSEELGWNAGIGFDLAEVVDMPITLGFSIAQWAEEDLTWAVNAGYTLEEIFAVTATVEQTEEDVIGYSLVGSISF